MIVTHVIALAYDYNFGKDPIVYYLGLFGGIASFTSFLFLSGINNYLAYVKIDDNNQEKLARKRRKISFRFLNIVLAYFILSAVYLIIYNKLYQLEFGDAW